jgi:hypothetical protein
MGNARSKGVQGSDCADGSCLTSSGKTYKKEYLKTKWSGTDRDGYRYSVDHAPTGKATCRGCKKGIAKGALRIGRSTPNPFDSESGSSDYTQYFHGTHAFDAMLKSRCTSKVVLSTSSLNGFSSLGAAEQKLVRSKVAAFSKKWSEKCGKA